MTGNELKEALEELNMNCRDFARAYDLHYNTVYAWTSGRNPIPSIVARHIDLLRELKALGSRMGLP